MLLLILLNLCIWDINVHFSPCNVATRRQTQCVLNERRFSDAPAGLYLLLQIRVVACGDIWLLDESEKIKSERQCDTTHKSYSVSFISLWHRGAFDHSINADALLVVPNHFQTFQLLKHNTVNGEFLLLSQMFLFYVYKYC